jgi:hypothetical protein
MDPEPGRRIIRLALDIPTDLVPDLHWVLDRLPDDWRLVRSDGLARNDRVPDLGGSGFGRAGSSDNPATPHRYDALMDLNIAEMAKQIETACATLESEIAALRKEKAKITAALKAKTEELELAKSMRPRRKVAAAPAVTE